MFRFSEALLFSALFGASMLATATDDYSGVGRAATPDEISAWDIDVRPDFLGLPAGSGSVTQGQAIFLAKCAACHGAGGESNAMFTSLIGGTTPADIESGRVASLSAGPTRERTVFMKLSTLSTLFDYIQRAMPWNQPKSLQTNEVYGVVAYLLNLAQVVPADFTLSNKNMAEVQALLPNRNGMTTDHGLWAGASAEQGGMGNGGKPDIQAAACMKDCADEIKLSPAVPPPMYKVMGNPAEQNRNYGAIRGTQMGSN